MDLTETLLNQLWSCFCWIWVAIFHPNFPNSESINHSIDCSILEEEPVSLSLPDQGHAQQGSCLHAWKSFGQQPQGRLSYQWRLTRSGTTVVSLQDFLQEIGKNVQLPGEIEWHNSCVFTGFLFASSCRTWTPWVDGHSSLLKLYKCHCQQL